MFFLVLAGVLVVLTSFVFDPYTNYNVAEIAIFAISAAGLTVLTGINGQVSLGHGALMMIGAYTTSVLLQWHPDLPVILMLFASMLTTAIAGAIIGIAGARLRGPYLAGATLSLAVALPQVPTHFASIFGGNQGISVPTPSPPDVLGGSFSPEQWFDVDLPRGSRDHVLPARQPRARRDRTPHADGPRQRGGGASRRHQCGPDAGPRLRDQRGVRRSGRIALRVLGDHHVADRVSRSTSRSRCSPRSSSAGSAA